MPFQLTSVISNVEASLVFTMSLKLVEVILSLLRVSGALEWKSRAGFVFVGTFVMVPHNSQPGKQYVQQPSAADVLWASLPVVACVVTLMITPAKMLSSFSVKPWSSERDSGTSVLRELLSTVSQITALAVARIGIMLLVANTYEDATNSTGGPTMLSESATVFAALRSMVHIMFGAIALSCIAALLTQPSSVAASSSPSDSDTSPPPAFQMLMANVQRALSQQISGLIPDTSTRKLVAAFGLCLFPSFSSILLPSSASAASSVAPITTISSLQGILLGIPSLPARSQEGADRRRGEDNDREPINLIQARMHAMFASFLIKTWVSGLCTTWLNISIDLLLQSMHEGGVAASSFSSSSSLGADLPSVAMLLVTGLGVCIVCKAMHSLVPGIQLFQGYVEWNVASVLIAMIQRVLIAEQSDSDAHQYQRSKIVLVSSTLIAFLFFDTIQRDLRSMQSRSPLATAATSMNQRKQKQTSSADGHAMHATLPPMIRQAVEVLHSVASIMFTNTLVSWAMDIFSDPSDPDDGGVGDAMAMLAVGIVVTRILLKVVSSTTEHSAIDGGKAGPGA